MNKVEDVRLQHELFNQNREKVGNTQYLLHDAESLQDEQKWRMSGYSMSSSTKIERR